MGNIKSILVADKSLKNLNFLGKGLKQQGYKVLAASEEKQLIAIAENKLPDILILSSSLVIGNSPGIFGAIKENKFLSKIIILLLQETNDGKWEKLYTENADVVVNAPYTLEEILKKIEIISGLKKKLKVETSDAKREKKKILFAEDNELNQNYVLAILEAQGLVVDMAGDGKIALEKFKNNRYDLLLTDINIPAINGLELTKIIRTEYKSNLPIMAVTGFTDKQFRHKCLAAGMNAVLTKPFEARQLVELVNSLLLIKQSPVSENVSERKKIKKNVKSYDYGDALQLANNDTELFNKWLIHFCKVVKETAIEVKTLISNESYQKKSRLFHGLLNYSLFFGIDELKGYIGQLVEAQGNPGNHEEVAALYKQIERELNEIDVFFSGLVNKN